MPVELFYSYSHRDEDLRAELEKHLSLLRRSGEVSEWHDRRLEPGAAWKGEIDAHLRSARVILLLISSDFLASDYCYDVEMKLALERHERGEAVVIPVILRPVDWAAAPFASLQALPKEAKPITTWLNRDEAFADVARGIRQAVLLLAAKPLQPALSTPPVRPEVQREQQRILDAALPKRVSVGSAVELLALIRRSESGGLRAVLQVEDEPDVSPEDVKSQPFRLEFPLDVTGRLEPLNVILRVDSPQFEPRSQVKEIRVPPDRDSEVCRFLLVPQQAGLLTLMLEVDMQGVYQAARVLRTSAETAPVLQPVGMLVVSLPLFTISGTTAGANFGTPTMGKAPRPVSPIPMAASPTPPPAASHPGQFRLERKRPKSAQPESDTSEPVPPTEPVPISPAPARTSSAWLKGLGAVAMLTVAIFAGYNYLAVSTSPQAAQIDIRVLDHLGAPVAGVMVRHEGREALTNSQGIAKLEVSQKVAQKTVEVTVTPPNAGPMMKVNAQPGIRKEVILSAPLKRPPAEKK